MFKRKKMDNQSETGRENNENLSQASVEEQETSNNTDNLSNEVNQEEGNTDDALVLEQQKYAQLHDSYIRIHAEFDNYRRRTAKEKSDLISFGNKDLLLQILPVMDDYERAVNMAQTSEDKDAIIEGFMLIYSKFQNTLQSIGVKPIEAKGEVFDTELHEAITTIPSPTPDLKGKVVDDVKKGYTLHNNILRHSQVVVGE
jgi:molecular chaperone GrpE